MANTRLPGQVIRSGSIPTTALSGGVVSRSVQVNYPEISNIPTGIISGSTQVVSAITGQTIAPSVVNASGAISGSTLNISGNGTIGGNLSVLGVLTAASQSIAYISSSQLNVGTNIITVNVQNPTVRFGGLAVIDSGSSPQRSGSLLFDSVNDQWIFVHQNQTNPTSSVVLMGPQTYNNIGNETNLTNNYLLKSVNAEHVGDSQIFDNGTNVGIGTIGNVGIGTNSPNTKLHIYTASVAADTNFIKVQMPSWSTSINYLKNIIWSDGSDVGAIGMKYDGSKVNMHFHSFYNGGYTTSASVMMVINGNGNVGIGTTNPGSLLHVQGAVSASSYTANGNTVWHAGNDGAGSGLDADLFDGENSVIFLKQLSGGTEANIDTYTDNGFRTISYTGHSKHLLSWNAGGSTGTVQQEFHYNTPVNSWRIRNKTDNTTWSDWGYVVMTSTNQGLLTGTVWTSGNDGASSGLDADLLDGNHAAAFATVGQTMYIGTTAVAINRGSGALSLTGVNIDGSAGSVAWSDISGHRTIERIDAGISGSGARSGFFQTDTPTNYYSGASSWQHLIEARHTNDSNNYAMQFAGSFYDQLFYARKTSNSATTAWSRLLTENSSGYVGIGTTSPQTKLNVLVGDGGSNGTAGIRVGSTSNYESLELGIIGAYGAMIRSYGNDINYYAGHWKTIGASATEDHAHYWYTSKAGSTNWSTAKMALTADGNVGIGLTNPGYKLSVSGSSIAIDGERLLVGQAYTPDPEYIGFKTSYQSGTNDYTIISGKSIDGNTYISAKAGSAVHIRGGGNAATHQLIISPSAAAFSGNVGIGTTSNHDSAKLDVRDGKIVAGTIGSTGGPVILQGYYSNGAITVFGSEYSNGGPVLGYAVKPSTSAAGAFLSSTGITVSRGAYVISGPNHTWYGGGSQTVAIDSSVSMTANMALTTTGLGIGTTSPAEKLEVNGSMKGGGGETSIYNFKNIAGRSSDSLLHLAGSTGLTGTVYLNYNGGTVSVGEATSATFNVNAGGLYVNTSKNVGIGTTTPAGLLTVYSGSNGALGGHILISNNGAAVANETAIIFGDGGSAYHRAAITTITENSPYHGAIAFKTGIGTYAQLTETVRITGAGSVGIGTSFPSAKLDVYSATDLGSGANGIRVHRPASYGQYGYLEYLISSDQTVLGSVYTGGGSSAYGQIYFRQHSSATSRTAMVINSSGNIGINTTSPNAELDIRGNLRVGVGSVANDMGATRYVTITTATIGQSTGVEFYGADGTYNPRAWITHTHSAGAQALTFNSTYSTGTGYANFNFLNGNVGIGTTSPGSKLHISGVGSNSGLQINTIKTYVTERLSAAATQARRFEIARIGIDYNDWNSVGIFMVELMEYYYSRGVYKRYQVSYGYNNNASACDLVEYNGTGDNSAQVTIGAAVQVAGDHYYLPVYVEVRYYGQYDVRIQTNREVTTNSSPASGTTYINLNPSATNISDFTADSQVKLAPQGGAYIAGNVGINDTSPGTKLVISNQGTINTTTPGATLYNLHFTGLSTNDYAQGITFNGGSSGAQAGLYVQGSSGYGTKMYFATTNDYGAGSKTRMMVDHNGNVGIGTTSPGYILDVIGRLRFRSNGVNSAGVWHTDNSGTENVFVGLGGISSTDDWGVYSNGAWRFQISNSTGIIYLNTKIAFESADSWLRINQSAAFSSGVWFGSTPNIALGGTDSYMSLGSNGGTTTSRIYFRAGTYNGSNVMNFDGTTGNAYFAGNLSVDGTLGFRRGSGDYGTYIKANGYPGQGYANSDGTKYWVELGGAGGVHVVLNTDGGPGSVENAYDHFTVWQGSNSGDRLFYVTNKGNTTVAGGLGVGTGASTTAGEIRATNEITAYYSDARLKNFHGRINNSLTKVTKLNGYYFTENEVAKSLGYTNDKIQIGLSAQEVQAVLPEAVVPAPIDDMYLTVKYEKLVPLLIEAIKEQQVLIQQLQEQVNVLSERQ